jgi:hypothetical protein
MRRVIAALIVVGLAVGVVLLWPRSTADDPPGAEASTTITTALTTTTALGTTTSTNDDSHVVETVEEAEEILRELWFGWFEGIYNQDEERIREVVATEHQYQLGVSQFGEMEFTRKPQMNDIAYSQTEILEATSECTVVSTTAMFSGFRNGTSTDVHVLRWRQGWKFFSLWSDPDELWEADCEAVLGSFSS